jgi:N-acetylmuramoyl-L-alanine amidase
MPSSASKLLQSKPFVKRAFLLVLLFICSFASSFAQTSSGYKIKTIVLDAGHGGHDTGCRGAFSYEKDVTLSIVLKLGEQVKKSISWCSRDLYTKHG